MTPRQILASYENTLLLKEEDAAGIKLRARALYSFGWIFITIQLINIIGMSVSYGRWTPDHWIAIIASCLVFAVIQTIRISRNFTLQVSILTLLCCAGVLSASLPDHTGIHSALLPLMIFMPVLCAFVAGPRIALMSCVLIIGILCILYSCSITHQDPALSLLSPRSTQRFLQAIYCVVLVSLFSALFSANTFKAFELLEKNVRKSKAAEQAKSTFLATMSHELRTPMNGVLGLIDVLERTELSNDQHKLLRTIGSSGRSLLAILNDVLDLSKIEADKLDITNTAFSLHQLIDEVSASWLTAAQEKALDFNVTMADGTPDQIVGDDLRVRQILTNLLSNAIKFTAAGHICLSVRATSKEDGHAIIEFKVSDTGIGISPEQRDHIFNAFEQADAGITRNYGGTGLGLSICQRLSTIMKGQLCVESTPQKGSTFTLSLPFDYVEKIATPLLFDQTANDPTLLDIEAMQQAVGNASILIVEDNLTNQLVAQHTLKSLGLTTQTANNGREALDCLDRDHFDVILMDKHMPILDGVAALHEIRKRSDTKANTPIIACTADAMNGERESLLGLGFDGFISKPIDQKALLAAIYSAMDINRTQQRDRARTA